MQGRVGRFFGCLQVVCPSPLIAIRYPTDIPLGHHALWAEEEIVRLPVQNSVIAGWQHDTYFPHDPEDTSLQCRSLLMQNGSRKPKRNSAYDSLRHS